MTRFKDRVALVIGGGANGPPRNPGELPMGNGRAIAMRLATEGAQVAVTDIDAAAANETVKSIGNGIAIKADASDPDACRSAVHQTEKSYGRLDIVICNVGISNWHKLKTQTLEDWQNSIDVNVTSNWITAQTAIPGMIDRKFGVFVFVTSLAAFASSGNSLAYEATKSAQLGIMRHIAVRYASRGIRSNALALGVIDSAMVRKAFGNEDNQHVSRDRMAPIGRQGRPDEVAAAATFLASDDASYITGSTLTVDGGLRASL